LCFFGSRRHRYVVYDDWTVLVKSFCQVDQTSTATCQPTRSLRFNSPRGAHHPAFSRRRPLPLFPATPPAAPLSPLARNAPPAPGSPCHSASRPGDQKEATRYSSVLYVAARNRQEQAINSKWQKSAHGKSGPLRGSVVYTTAPVQIFHGIATRKPRPALYVSLNYVRAHQSTLEHTW
jgi:hypothetical protein